MFAKSSVASFTLAVFLLASNGLALTSLKCGNFKIDYSCNKEQPLMNLDYVRVIGCKCDQKLGTAIQNLIKSNPAAYLDGPMGNTCCNGKQDLTVGTNDHTDACKPRDVTFVTSLCEILKAASVECRAVECQGC